jgi:predicted regulator of Ras-like GTPase activity (Roadblock/LC7/MglB family)
MTALEHVQLAIGTTQLLVADYSGNVLACVPNEEDRNIVLLAALGAGNFAAIDEMLKFSGAQPKSDAPQVLSVDGANGHLILCRSPQGLVFIASIGANTMLGLARIELRELAQTNWADLYDTPQRQSATLAADLAQQFVDSIDIEL